MIFHVTKLFEVGSKKCVEDWVLSDRYVSDYRKSFRLTRGYVEVVDSLEIFLVSLH